MNVEQVNASIPKTEYLWKYLDLHKFMYFIREKKIYFSRFDTFEDPHEGLPYRTVVKKFYFDLLPKDNKLNPALFRNETEKAEFIHNTKTEKNNLDKEIQEFQQKNFASCWFMDDERESVAMWKLYSNPDSVCIVLKRTDLENRLRAYAENEDTPIDGTLYYGPVWYGKIYPPDRINQTILPSIPEGFMKDQSYFHEKEYRFLISLLTNPDGNKAFFEIPTDNIESLIINIKAHPNMEEWKIENLKSLLNNSVLKEKFNPSTIKFRRK